MLILADLFKNAVRSAIHLEMRDSYQPDDPDWLDWRDGRRFDPAQRWNEWFTMMSETTARGVEVRRARLIDEPVTEYIRYEYDVTEPFNLASGEEVRWLPRRRAAGMLVPAVDFWIFDGTTIVINHFDGYGGNLQHEQVNDESLAARYAAAFEDIWGRAIPHAEYVI